MNVRKARPDEEIGTMNVRKARPDANGMRPDGAVRKAQVAGRGRGRGGAHARAHPAWCDGLVWVN